ncbi:MAG: phosphatase PAP2 family protein [Candidatus Marinimicrobia bacterium]|nr:phosphatase PAP2 family protein [Candidatus Neomarinimicrobiota bacterium]MCH7762298.1 phosphatase PAP2 family protein [Candidatus Neomarinimicrobiota bacterium]
MLNHIDKLILLYELLLTVHILLFNHNIPDWIGHIQLNIIISGWILFSAWAAKHVDRQPFKFLHTFYPIFLLIWHYPQACELRYSVIPFSLDHIIYEWDLVLFQLPLYEILPKKLNLMGLELFHFFYFTHYLILGIPAWIVYKSRHPKIPEYIFVLTLTFIIHQWFLIFIPADGPVLLRQEIMPDGLLFIPIMNLIYQLDAGGGAFPSLHVAGTLITCIYANTFLPKLKPLWIFAFAAITISTVICSYHYPLDSLIGGITGWLCYIYIPRIYDYMHRK